MTSALYTETHFCQVQAFNFSDFLSKKKLLTFRFFFIMKRDTFFQNVFFHVLRAPFMKRRDFPSKSFSKKTRSLRSIPRLKDCIFWNHVNVYSNFFHLKTYCLKKSCKVAVQKRSSTYLHLHLSLGICNIVVLQSDKPSLRTIPTVCNCATKKGLPFLSLSLAPFMLIA